MAQLTVYLDSEVLNRIEAAAVKSNLSVSKWVREKLENALKNEWPASYFLYLVLLKILIYRKQKRLISNKISKGRNFDLSSRYKYLYLCA